MVKVYTLFHRVDGFDELKTSSTIPDILDQELGDQLLEEILNPLIHDPGEELVKTILKKIWRGAAMAPFFFTFPYLNFRYSHSVLKFAGKPQIVGTLVGKTFKDDKIIE